jgi:hypothetical protein
LIPTQEVVDPNNVVPYTRTSYVVNNMYVPIVEPTLMGPRVMPPWQTIVPPYIVGYSSSTLAVTHTILAPPRHFPLGNNGSLLDFFGYMGNAQQHSELQVMTKFRGATDNLLKVDSCLTKAPI